MAQSFGVMTWRPLTNEVGVNSSPARDRFLSNYMWEDCLNRLHDGTAKWWNCVGFLLQGV